MKQYTSILIENRANLRIIKFNNPKRKNAFDMRSYVEIPDALNDAENDASVSIVALTGVGDYYSSGNDIKAAMTSVFSGRDIDELLTESHKDLKQFVSKFYSFKKPLVAVINGPCIGIGATTAALCDVLYASESAYFYTPFTLMGLCPEGCSSYTFAKMLGPSKANEMLMFHHKLSAQEAYQYKFVAGLFNPDEIETKIWQKLEKLSKLPPTSLQSAKMLTKKFELERLEEANAAEVAELINRWKSEEAMNAAMEFTSRKKSDGEYPIDLFDIEEDSYHGGENSIRVSEFLQENIISAFQENVIGYISGYVVKMARKIIWWSPHLGTKIIIFKNEVA